MILGQHGHKDIEWSLWCQCEAELGGRGEGVILGGRVEGVILGGRVEGVILGGRVGVHGTTTAGKAALD